MKLKIETSAGGIVFKKVISLWLICQHSQHKGWVFPKGLIDDMKKGETMEEAALREVEEEGGVKAEIVSHTPVSTEYFYKKNGQLIKKTVYFFLMKYLSGDPKNHDHEMMNARFVTKDEVKKTLTYKNDKEAFEKILKLMKA